MSHDTGQCRLQTIVKPYLFTVTQHEHEDQTAQAGMSWTWRNILTKPAHLTASSLQFTSAARACNYCHHKYLQV